MLKQGLEQTTQEENDFSMRVLLSGVLPENVLSFFSGNKKSLTRCSVAKLKAMVDQMSSDDFISFCKKNKPDLLKTCETDGKSVMDHIHEKINKSIAANQEKISDYLGENAEVFKTAAELRKRISLLKLSQSTKRAVPIFHSETLLDRLGIPKDSRPDIILTPAILEQAKNATPPEIHYETDPVEFLTQLCAIQENNHPEDIIPCHERNFDIIEKVVEQKIKLSELKALQESIGNYARTIAIFPDKEKSPVEKFIGYLKEPKFLEACPWMRDYKPDEKEFLSKIYDEWEKHANDLLRFQDNFKEAVMSEDKETAYLRSYGFYDWQPDRDPKKIAVQTKEQKLTI